MPLSNHLQMPQHLDHYSPTNFHDYAKRFHAPKVLSFSWILIEEKKLKLLSLRNFSIKSFWRLIEKNLIQTKLLKILKSDKDKYFPLWVNIINLVQFNYIFIKPFFLMLCKGFTFKVWSMWMIGKRKNQKTCHAWQVSFNIWGCGPCGW